MSVYSANHKPLPELDIEPEDIPLLVTAARQLPDVSDRKALSFGGWLLMVHHEGDDAAASSASRAEYRKILKALAAQGHLPTPPRLRRRGGAGQSACLTAADPLAA